MDINKTNNSTTSTDHVISWQAPEFQEYKKHPFWFIGLALLIAAVVLYAILIESWSMAVTFILLGILGIVFGSQKPKTVDIHINGVGIQINNVLYNYREIKKFWIIYIPGELKILYLETSSIINRIVKIQLEDQNPQPIREYLKTYIHEDLDQQESLVDVIARKLKF